MKKKHKICITGGSFINKGAEAMVLTVSKKLKEAFDDIEIYVRITRPYFDYARRYGLIPIDSTKPVTYLSKIVSKVKNFTRYMYLDTIIDVGGYQFGEPWGIEHTKRVAKSISYGKMFNIKYILMPQAWGPFVNSKFTSYIKKILDNSELYYVRDKESFNYLNQLVTIDKTCLKHDIAWSFTSNTSVDFIYKKYNIDIKKHSVCITPNLRVFEREGEKYIDFISCIIDYLTSKNYQIILLGHELRCIDEKDDRILCRKIKTKCPSAINIDSYISAQEIKSLIGICDFIISSRFHALIAALSQEIPAIAIGWSHKYVELLKDAGLTNNILDIPNTSSFENHIEVFFNLFHNSYTEQKKILQNTVPIIKKDSADMLKEVIDHVK